jgi:DNA anti-recombination protein RmuC
MANYTEALASAQALTTMLGHFQTVCAALQDAATLETEVAEKRTLLARLAADLEAGKAELASIEATIAAKTAGVEQALSDARAEAARMVTEAEARAAAHVASAENRIADMGRAAEQTAAGILEQARLEGSRIKAGAESELEVLGARLKAARDHIATLGSF